MVGLNWLSQLKVMLEKQKGVQFEYPIGPIAKLAYKWAQSAPKFWAKVWLELIKIGTEVIK